MAKRCGKLPPNSKVQTNGWQALLAKPTWPELKSFLRPWDKKPWMKKGLFSPWSTKYIFMTLNILTETQTKVCKLKNQSPNQNITLLCPCFFLWGDNEITDSIWQIPSHVVWCVKSSKRKVQEKGWCKKSKADISNAFSKMEKSEERERNFLQCKFCKIIVFLQKKKHRIIMPFDLQLTTNKWLYNFENVMLCFRGHSNMKDTVKEKPTKSKQPLQFISKITCP